MKKKSTRWMKALGFAALASCMVFTTSAGVFAADTATSTSESEDANRVISDGLEMSTSYPGVSAKPGSTVSFDLDFANGGSGELVSLSSSGVPDGATGYFQGGGNTISNVYVKNGQNSALATFSVDLPEDLAEGTYTITLTAQGETSSDTLDLALNVSQEDLGASTLTADYDSQEGTSDGTFTFNTTLQNNSTSDQSYSLSAESPDGWTTTFTPSGESNNVSSVDVKGGSTSSVTVTVTPKKDADAGDYEIPITAKSANETLNLTLKVKITGTYSLSLTTQDQTLSFNAKANKKTAVVIDVVNNSNLPLTNINLTASAPTDWTVEFSESTIDSLEAGKTKEVTAYVTPSQSSISGDYAVTMTASATETSSDQQFRVTVQTQTVWGVVGVVVIIAIAAALVAVFRKFGRH